MNSLWSYALNARRALSSMLYSRLSEILDALLRITRGIAIIQGNQRKKGPVQTAKVPVIRLCLDPSVPISRHASTPHASPAVLSVLDIRSVFVSLSSIFIIESEGVPTLSMFPLTSRTTIATGSTSSTLIRGEIEPSSHSQCRRRRGQVSSKLKKSR